ncbi:50S ribosomal protein L25 [Candidatus Aerophobetes bacterium]|nr:50S ribosomal protein L25 [Candidatus Aerophobetes bacterium]
MESPVLNVRIREKTGKAEAKRLRKRGFVPAILYGAHLDRPVPLQVENSQLLEFLSSLSEENRIITLRIIDKDREEKREAIIKDAQYNLRKGQVEHVDFYEIKRGEKISATVRLRLLGENIVAKKGGVVEQMVREVEVECVPENLPAHIDVDISGLKIGDAIKVKDLKAPAGVRILTNPEEIVVSVVSPVSEEEIEILEEERGVMAEEVEVIQKERKEEVKEEAKKEGQQKESKKKEE